MVDLLCAVVDRGPESAGADGGGREVQGARAAVGRRATAARVRRGGGYLLTYLLMPNSHRRPDTTCQAVRIEYGDRLANLNS